MEARDQQDAAAGTRVEPARDEPQQHGEHEDHGHRDHDVADGQAELQRQVQELARAELDLALSTRSLQSLTSLTPELSAAPALRDDLRPEAPLAQYDPDESELPAVMAAKLGCRAAAAQATAQWLQLVPSLEASFAERLTNATSFIGRTDNWTH